LDGGGKEHRFPGWRSSRGGGLVAASINLLNVRKSHWGGSGKLCPKKIEAGTHRNKKPPDTEEETGKGEGEAGEGLLWVHQGESAVLGGGLTSCRA